MDSAYPFKKGRYLSLKSENLKISGGAYFHRAKSQNVRLCSFLRKSIHFHPYKT